MDILRKIAIYFCLILNALVSNGQCWPLTGDSPAFEFNIPEGAVIDSVILRVHNYLRNGESRSRGRSFNLLETTPWFYNDTAFKVLQSPIIGPNFADFQIVSGLDFLFGFPGENIRFDWVVEIYASSISGTNLDFKGELNDNLAIPDNLGSVYNGINLVTGSINSTLAGNSIILFQDFDFDGFGDNMKSSW